MFLQPMLAEKREHPFDDDRFIFEPKIDGHRLIMSIRDGAVRLYTRHGNDVTRQYPELHDVPITDDTDAILDGEVAVVDQDTGAVQFEAVMQRFQLRKELRIREASIRKPVQYFVFDILRYRGTDLRSRPLFERKQLLDQVLTNNRYFSKLIHVEGAGTTLFDLIKQRGLEGIVAKRNDSLYVGRRISEWMKIINYQFTVVQIAGYRKEKFGWLLQHQNKPAGILELAIPAAHRKAFFSVSRNIVTGEDRNFVYVQPRIQARVKFRNWTRNGMLRSPEFIEFVTHPLDKNECSWL